MDRSFKCRTFREEDREAVRQLVESTIDTFSTGKYWDWKYPRNIGYDHSQVAVAESDGRIIGCNHWLQSRIKLSDSIVVESMIGTGIAVAPEFRRKGVGRALVHFLRSLHDNRKPTLMHMFAYPDLSRHFHTPIFGYVPLPSSTVLYMKVLSWNKVKKSVIAFNERVELGEFAKRLARVDLTIALKVHGAPEVWLHLDSNGIGTDVSARKPDVTISSDLATLRKIRSMHFALRMLIQLLLTGKLSIRGDVRKMLALYKNRWVFRIIFREKTI